MICTDIIKYMRVNTDISALNLRWHCYQIVNMPFKTSTAQHFRRTNERHIIRLTR